MGTKDCSVWILSRSSLIRNMIRNMIRKMMQRNGNRPWNGRIRYL
jgi:hypothetical protein